MKEGRYIAASWGVYRNLREWYPILHSPIAISYFRKDKIFLGWGRKPSGERARKLAKFFGGEALFVEDGFIRSIGLGISGSPSFSIVEDDEGIYYDASRPNLLERMLRSHDFEKDEALMSLAHRAMDMIRKHKISKYNRGKLTLPRELKGGLEKRVLIVAQTAGDASLIYGMALEDSRRMIRDAVAENPGARICLRVHPDVLTGWKESNVDLEYAREHCEILTEDTHPIVLLEAFDKVYTQTSQMGFEALMLGKEVHLYGVPFYAGWHLPGLHQRLDAELPKRQEEIRNVLKRRGRTLQVEELFAGAYLLYSRYHNPYTHRPSNIIEVIEEIIKQRKSE